MKHHDSVTTNERLLLSVAELADLLGVSERHIHNLRTQGQLPEPVRLGRVVRWDASEIRAWITAGAPPRGHWEGLRAGGALRSGQVGASLDS